MQIKGEKGYCILAHGFGGFSPWSIGLTAFGPVVRQHRGREHLEEVAAYLTSTSKYKRETESARTPVSPSKVCPPKTSLPPLATPPKVSITSNRDRLENLQHMSF